MPIYEYRCNECHSEYEIYQNFHESAKRKCKNCGLFGLERLISMTLGFVDPGITTIGKLAEVNAKKMGSQIKEEADRTGATEKKKVQDEYKRINKMTAKEKIRYIEEGR